MKNSQLAAVTAGTALVLVMAACSPPTSQGGGSKETEAAAAAAATAQEAFDEISALTGDARQEALVSKAEEEGTLSLYTSNVNMEDIIDLFEDTYDVTVDVYLGTSESVLQRAQQEHEAGYFGSDVVEGNGDALDILNDEGIFSDYEPPARSELPEAAQADGWTASRFAVYAMAWNTDLLPAEDEPTSFEDLADPKYAGKLSVELGDYDWYYTLKQHYLDSGMPEDEVDDMFTKIAENATAAKGHTQQAQFLAAGQFAICVACYTDAVDRAAADGAPVTWHGASGDAIEPLVVRTSGTAVMSTSQHPYAAMLFQDFMLSAQTQEYLASAYRVGTVPGKGDPLAGYDTVPMDWDVIRENATEAQADYDELLRHAAAASS